VPYITTCLDPFERTGWPAMERKTVRSNTSIGSSSQFWRFVFVQQLMAKELRPSSITRRCRRGASFNLDAVKAEMAKKMAEAQAASKGAGQ